MRAELVSQLSRRCAARSRARRARARARGIAYRGECFYT